MQREINVEELISSIKKEALETGLYCDTMEATFDSLCQIVRNIEDVKAGLTLICKGKWEVCNYLLGIIKLMDKNYTDMFFLVDALMQAKPGSNYKIFMNTDSVRWRYLEDEDSKYKRKFFVYVREECGNIVPYLYEEV